MKKRSLHSLLLGTATLSTLFFSTEVLAEVSAETMQNIDTVVEQETIGADTADLSSDTPISHETPSDSGTLADHLEESASTTSVSDLKVPEIKENSEVAPVTVPYEKPFEKEVNPFTASFDALELEEEDSVAEYAPREGVNRVSGINRYDNSAAISKAGWKEADSVFIANGNDNTLADSLTGTALANSYDAPLLLSKKDSINSEVIDEIKRLKAKNVVILGGENSITKAVEEQLKQANLNVGRIGGRNRYHQAALVAEQVMDQKDAKLDTLQKHNVFLVNSHAYADAMSIAPISAVEQQPVLLTYRDSLHDDFLQLTDRIGHVTILGGTSSIATSVEKQLAALNLTFNRISGRNRYEVNRKILDQYGIPQEEFYVASGEIYSDGLPVSSLAAKENKALLLVKNDNLSEMKDQLSALHNGEEDNAYTIVGGSSTISLETQEWLTRPDQTLQLESVKKRERVYSQPAIITSNVALTERPAGTDIYKQLIDRSNPVGKLVLIQELVTLSDGSKHARVIREDNKIGYVPMANLLGEHLLENVNYYSQYAPVYAGWGSAGASAAMLLSNNGHTFSAQELRELIYGIPTRDQHPGGQDGNIQNGEGFTRIIQPSALVPYLQAYDSAVTNFNGATMHDIIKEILNGHAVMYYGVSAYDPYNHNHIKVITGYKNGNFRIYDPLYWDANGKPLSSPQRASDKYDRGARHWVEFKDLQEEQNGQFIIIR